MTQLTIIHRKPHLREWVQHCRSERARIALIPTMGALHAGHIALVDRAKTIADKVVVSIFVNPTQFGPNEDFSRYPRTLENDIALLKAASADAVYAPDVAEIYTPENTTNIHVKSLSEGLCGAFRPGHFEGVATIVAKLLLQTLPDAALFGEKDYQQLQVIRRMTADLDIPVEIHGVPTLREVDGLALSSRNRYLNERERTVAATLYATLIKARAQLHETPQDAASILAAGEKTLLEAGFTKIDYLELRHAHTLAPLTLYTPPARLLAAAWLGTTRLIDNIAMEE